MKKFVAQALSLALVLSILMPVSVLPGGGDTPPDEEPGISICGDEWDEMLKK